MGRGILDGGTFLEHMVLQQGGKGSVAMEQLQGQLMYEGSGGGSSTPDYPNINRKE